MTTEALRKLIEDYQLGLRDDIEILGSYFSDTWVFVDEDGYELTMLYGNGLYAIFYLHRSLKQIVIDFLSEANPLIEFINGLEKQFGISIEA